MKARVFFVAGVSTVATRLRDVRRRLRMQRTLTLTARFLSSLPKDRKLGVPTSAGLALHRRRILLTENPANNCLIAQTQSGETPMEKTRPAPGNGFSANA